MKLAHEDDRRRLFEWPVCKRLEIKRSCMIGGHYHRKKTEVFVLTKGDGRIFRKDMRQGTPFLSDVRMKLGQEYTVGPLCWHELRVGEGSVVLCLASATHDPADDHTK